MNRKLFLVLIIAVAVLSGCTNQQQSSSSPSSKPTSSSLTSEPDPTLVPVLEKDVVLEVPEENSAVSSTFAVEGLAPGTWFFEGQITGEVHNEDGTVLTTFPLVAEGEWMTEEHVKFKGKAEFDVPTSGETIVLVIKNDNSSGLPENDKSQEFTLHLEQ